MLFYGFSKEKGRFLNLSTLEIISEKENKLLSRREITANFRAGSGLITRQAAADAISSRMGVGKDKVRIMSLRGKFGVRDLVAQAYIYTDSKQTGAQLPKYLGIRDLPTKDERKKAREALKPKAGPAAAGEAKKS